MNPLNPRPAKRQIPVSVLLIVGVALLAYGCRPNGETPDWPAAQAELVRQAGQRLRVPVRTDRMANFAQPGVSWFAAPAANLETIPATELPRGVDIGVAYFDLPGQKFPKGFYKIHAVADVKLVGRVEGKAQLINEKGETVGEVPATVEVKSMTVPADVGSRLTTVSICTGAACNIGGGTPPITGFWACQSCPNGWHACFYVGFLPEF